MVCLWLAFFQAGNPTMPDEPFTPSRSSLPLVGRVGVEDDRNRMRLGIRFSRACASTSMARGSSSYLCVWPREI